ncbi:hypothetical protein FRC18_010951 [Serendipita sp. 400]|nr:hypothetical protein FRC18_010951 [Serendipita sp. 400]
MPSNRPKYGGNCNSSGDEFSHVKSSPLECGSAATRSIKLPCMTTSTMLGMKRRIIIGGGVSRGDQL